MWVVRVFQKDGEEMVDEIQIDGFDDELIRPLLNIPIGVPMYDSYPVTPQIARVLEKYITKPLSLDAFDYFLEFDAD